MATTELKSRLKYEPEADVLSWELSNATIDYAEEVGDMIVHFAKDHKPVLIEVVHAKEFMKTAENVVGIRRIHPEMATI